MSLFLCKTIDTETGATDIFLCVAKDVSELRSYFTDNITKLVEVYSKEQLESVILNDYNGLALLHSI